MPEGKPPIEVGGPPLTTEDPDTPGKGGWEVNVAYTTEHSSDERLSEFPVLDLSYGLFEPVEVTFEMPAYLSSREEGGVQKRMGDPTAGIKWRFFEHGRFAVSVFPQVTFNNSNSKFLQSFGHATQWILPVEAQFKLLWFKFDGELGREFNSGETLDEWQWGLATRHKISKTFKLVGEVHGSGNSLTSPDELVFNLGTTLQPHRGLPTALFSIGRSLPGQRVNKPTLLVYTGAQLTW
jgi:hypothetical protein